MRHAAIAGCQETLAVTPRKLPLCRAISYPAIQAVGWAVLVRGTGPVAQTFVARELNVYYPFPGPVGRILSNAFRHHRDGATSTSNRLVYGNLLHSASLKRSRNVVLGDVVRGGLLGVVEHVWRQHRWQTLGVSLRSWGLTQGLHRCTDTRRQASAPGISEGRSKYGGLAPRGAPSGVSAEAQGPTARTLQGPAQLSESLTPWHPCQSSRPSGWWLLILRLRTS